MNISVLTGDELSALTTHGYSSKTSSCMVGVGGALEAWLLFYSQQPCLHCIDSNMQILQALTHARNPQSCDLSRAAPWLLDQSLQLLQTGSAC